LRTQQAVTPAAAKGITVAECRRTWAAEFRAGGIDSPELDARVLIGHALGLDHAALAVRADRALSA
jgi:release factor glutamine methyltransferase